MSEKGENRDTRVNKENTMDTAKTAKIIKQEDLEKTIDRETYSDIESRSKRRTTTGGGHERSAKEHDSLRWE